MQQTRMPVRESLREGPVGDAPDGGDIGVVVSGIAVSNCIHPLRRQLIPMM